MSELKTVPKSYLSQVYPKFTPVSSVEHIEIIEGDRAQYYEVCGTQR